MVVLVVEYLFHGSSLANPGDRVCGAGSILEGVRAPASCVSFVPYAAHLWWLGFFVLEG